VYWGADAVKILIYYSAVRRRTGERREAPFVERIGAECDACDIPFFLGIRGYEPKAATSAPRVREG